MIEPVTLFTTIAGVANLASRLTIDLTRITVALRNVPDQITQVCSETVALNATLATLQQRFNPTSSGYSAEQLLCLETVITSTKETLVQLAKLSDAWEATGKKKIAKGGVSGMWKKVNWTLNEAEIASYRSGLVGYTAMLNLLTATLADQRGANIEAMVTKTNEMLEALVERRNRLSILSAEGVENAMDHKSERRSRSRPPSARTRSSSVAGRSSESRGHSAAMQSRSQSVAPPMSRGRSASIAPTDARSASSSRRSGPSSVHSRAGSSLRSASTSNLPLRISSPPPLPAAASQLHLSIPPTRSRAPSHGLPSPPPEYTEIAPGLYDEMPQTPRSQRQVLRSAPLPPPSVLRSAPLPPPSARPSSTRSSSSRPTYGRTLSSSSTRSASTVQAPPVPPVPPVPQVPSPYLAGDVSNGHKLEFSGKWSIKAIRINESFMGSGTVFLKKDDQNKRVLFNIRLDSSRDTRLSYRWVESSSATRTKPGSMFGGPSYILRSLVRADDYSGVSAGKTIIRLEDIEYLAGQRSFMIAINLIQQSPAEWLRDTNTYQARCAMSPLGIESPSAAGQFYGHQFRSIGAPPESVISEPYSPASSYHDFPAHNFSRPNTREPHAMRAYASLGMPPTPPRSPSEDSADSRNRRPSISGGVSVADSQASRLSSDRMPPAPPGRLTGRRDARMVGAGAPNDVVRVEDSGEVSAATARRGRERSRRGPAAWFSFGRN
ncbi:hypothetical protein DRE_03526 [Drechslerella stenobrocha 248]|uniref:Fungal N-terminal domain-containing protein n=1 Tax=Drechslerella stenobrocha 248 TaxID=1043628 RepID=W7I412_9PEZI|nr:hypothetical protein DRE_03526 [Drechslerella stenobrocha 248]